MVRPPTGSTLSAPSAASVGYKSRHQTRAAWALGQRLPAADLPPGALHQARRYAVLGGGKRIRPVLVYLSGAAVATSYNAKGVVAEDRPYSVGMLGTWGMAAANRPLEQADCGIVLGASLGPGHTRFRAAKLIRPRGPTPPPHMPPPAAREEGDPGSALGPRPPFVPQGGLELQQRNLGGPA